MSHYTAEEGWALRKCGLDHCPRCERWFFPGPDGAGAELYCPACDPRVECPRCKRVHGASAGPCRNVVVEPRSPLPRGGGRP